MGQIHRYRTTVTWIGNRGRGTADYAAYGRDFTASAVGKPDIAGSADPAISRRCRATGALCLC